MQVLVQKLLQFSQKVSGTTEYLADFVGLQHLVQKLNDQVTFMESQCSDLKFYVTTNMKAQGTKLGFCVAEIKNIQDNILDLEKKNDEIVTY